MQLANKSNKEVDNFIKDPHFLGLCLVQRKKKKIKADL